MQCFILGLHRRVENMAELSTSQLYERVGQNTGNLAFHEAIDSHLGGAMQSISWYADSLRIDEAGDIGVIPAANQPGPHADFGALAQRFKDIRCRLVMVGLGAQSPMKDIIPKVPEGTLQWLREIARRSPSAAPNIAVRGEFSL